MFPDQNNIVFRGKEPVKEEIIIEPETKKTSFIDKVLGRSRSRQNRKEQYSSMEPITPKLMEETEEITFSTDEETDNLDIPAFLRKK